MADIDPAATVETKETVEPEKAAAPDHAKEISELRQKFALMEQGYKKDMEAGKRERDMLLQQINAPKAPVATQIDAIQKEIDKTYEEKGFTAGFYKAAMDLLNKPITEQFAVRDTRLNSMDERFAKYQRYDVKRDERCTPEIMLAVDAVMEKLSPSERAEPGAYRECLDQILEREEFAELKLNSAGDQGRVITRKAQSSRDDLDEPTLTAEEKAWAKRDGMTEKEYIHFRDTKEINPYE